MKENLLKVSARLINDKAKFSCNAKGKPPIISDYIPPLGDGEGYTSLELLLLSLSSCLASTVKFIITGPLKKTVSAIEAKATGERRTEHPTSLHKISIFLEIESEELETDELDGVIRMAEDRLCPVYDMLRGNTEIEIEYAIRKGVLS